MIMFTPILDVHGLGKGSVLQAELPLEQEPIPVALCLRPRLLRIEMHMIDRLAGPHMGYHVRQLSDRVFDAIGHEPACGTEPRCIVLEFTPPVREMTRQCRPATAPCRPGNYRTRGHNFSLTLSSSKAAALMLGISASISARSTARPSLRGATAAWTIAPPNSATTSRRCATCSTSSGACARITTGPGSISSASAMTRRNHVAFDTCPTKAWRTTAAYCSAVRRTST